MKELLIRRSVRKYIKKEITEKTINDLLKAGVAAPSALNEQPWEFIVVTEQELLDKLSMVSPHAYFIKDASCLIIVLGNKNKVKSTLYTQDLSACTQNILLAATSKKLGSCWIGTYPKEDRMNYVIDLFNLPENIEPFSMITIGYPEDESVFKEVERLNEEIIHRNEW